jgi:hypothetical protein
MTNKHTSKGLGLQQTKGSFQIRGKLLGVEKENFYNEITTKTNKPMRMLNIAVEIDKNKSIYLNLNGIEKEKVYFCKTEGQGKERKTTTEAVNWANRFNFSKDGYKLIGVNLGLVKILDSTGKEVNDKKTLTEYDACKYISDNAKDGMSVFVRGTTEYSTYENKHNIKFVPQQISCCKEIDFESEDFEVLGNFEQTIVFMGISKNDDGNFAISAKIITYSTVEDAEFIIDKNNVKFANTLRKLKPYTSLKIYGNILVEHDIEQIEQEDDDGWGTSNPMEALRNPTRRIMLVTGADKDSVDTELYSEEVINEAIKKTKANQNADKDFGSDNDWGSISDDDLTDEDEEW